MGKYIFGETMYTNTHGSWQRILQKAHAAKIRPVCACSNPPNQCLMYVAHARGTYQIKRMPDTGSMHAAFCEHYEPPAELSGLGQVAGTAIREIAETDTTVLSLDFPLTKGRSRLAGTPSEVEHESVKADGTKLTMRGFLHYLWDQANLTRWTPAMENKRSWYIVRRELLDAGSSKLAKGKPLANFLFLPETFNLEKQDEINTRRVATLSRLALQSTDRMIFIAPVKSFDDARFGKSLTLKHLPDMRLMMSDDMHKHITSRFAHQLLLWGQLDNTNLVTISTVSRSSQGVYSVEACCLVNVNSNWIPFETAFEHELLQQLHLTARRFVKGLRYNLHSTKPLACAVMQDTGDKPAALFVVPQEAASSYDETIDVVTNEGRLNVWRWNAGVENLPALPNRLVGTHERP